ncbi:MAG: hypothetical protein J0L96_03720 [Anaerolineae bacterium]|nr:hypothetical protein [Anaerolineae bacterium]
MFGLDPHDINTILFTSLTSAIVTGVVVYLIQKSIENSFNKRLEEFRANIQYTLFEQQTKFTRTYQKKIETLEALHQKIFLFLKNSHKLAEVTKNILSASPGKGKERNAEIDEATEKVSAAYFDYLHFYAENRLFLPDKSIEVIEGINLKLGILFLFLTLSYGIHLAPPNIISWANQGIKDFDINIKKINPKKINASSFIDQIMEEIIDQEEIFEEHYKSIVMDNGKSIVKDHP